ncbi:MAG: hypothetical protein ACE5OZ_17115 [Candidatus Heimdallarchaeota archaeon]
MNDVLMVEIDSSSAGVGRKTIFVALPCGRKTCRFLGVERCDDCPNHYRSQRRLAG